APYSGTPAKAAETRLARFNVAPMQESFSAKGAELDSQVLTSAAFSVRLPKQADVERVRCGVSRCNPRLQDFTGYS
ncbi:unnamed protein product, partial [Symbiodinium microadriaticum]